MNKTIVITGGSDGLGKAIAKELINDNNNNIVIISHNIDNLTNTANELKCNYMLCDVTDYNSVDNTIKSIIKKYKKIDCLINSAGV